MKRIFLVLLGMASLNVHAFDPTQGPLQTDPSLCSYGYNSNCGSGSSRGRQPEKIIQYINVDIPPKFGALAFDPTTATTGSSYNASSKEQAIQGALDSCSAGGKNKHCKLMVWVRNTCIAGADGRTKSGTFKFYHASGLPGKAEPNAIKRCQQDPELTDCHIVFKEMCSLDY